ncbi:MAG: Holliday junction branch migration protein RuvA [Actinomycetota bacterium]
MISLLEGRIAEKSADRVVVSVAGAGYEALVPAASISKLPAVGKNAKLYTRLHIRDDSMILYGFASADERALFDLIVKVNGVGPKFALAILSVLSPDAFRKAVASGDVDALTVVPGIGKKVANRILLDLKDKLGGAAEVLPAGPLAEVREALLALGLTPQEAREAMASLGADNGQSDRPVEEMLRDALQEVGRV